jgi:hypothetical protein
MTIHLVSPNTIHAACARFARRPRVTTDPAQVTCKRCLKLRPGWDNYRAPASRSAQEAK